MPGLIGQIRGFLTRKRHKVTMAFVDHYSGYSHVHFQQSTSALETLEAKRCFERFAKSYRTRIGHYHADNGIFAEKGFVDQVHDSSQTMSFCAVNAHHQNGVAKKKIRDLQEAARTMLVHAKQRWPTAITANLWPHAIRMANAVTNRAPKLKESTVSPIDVEPVVKHSHAVGQSDLSIQSQSHIELHSRERSLVHRCRDIDI